MTEEDFKFLVGKKLDEAKKEMPEPYFICIVNENGVPKYRSYDYNKRRVCVWTYNEEIIKVEAIY